MNIGGISGQGGGLCDSDDGRSGVIGGDDGRIAPGGPGPGDGVEQLLVELKELARVLDPVPAEVLGAARGSLAWRGVDAELAEVSFDSSVDGDVEPAGVGTDDIRTVSFDAPELTVEVQIARDLEHRRLVGRLVPSQPATVELRTATGPPGAAARATETDHLGRFVLSPVGRGPASLRCVLGRGRAVETPWLII